MSDRYENIFKMEFDFFKHLTTLCTGSIVILVAFYDNFVNPMRPDTDVRLLFLSLFAFVLCITGSSFSMYSIILEQLRKRKLDSDTEDRDRPTVRPLIWTLPNFPMFCYVVKFLSGLAFLCGVLTLVLFALFTL